jgi:hypothetical protein
MGVERNLDGGQVMKGFLSNLQESIRGAFQGTSFGTASASVQVDIDVKDAKLKATEEAMDRLAQAGKSGTPYMPSAAPSPVPSVLPEVPPLSGSDLAWRRFDLVEPGRHRAPVDYGSPDAPPPGQTPGSRASSLWSQIKEGGAIHTLREAGRFGGSWLGALQGDEKEEATRWMSLGGRREAFQASESFEGIEKAGRRVAALFREIEKFGEKAPESIRAAAEIEKLRARIDELASSGKVAADSLGGAEGARARAEIEAVQRAAGAGSMAPPPDERGGLGLPHIGVRDLGYMARDPLGAARSLASRSILQAIMQSGLSKALQAPSLAGAGGAMEALGGGAGGAAGVAGLGAGALVAGLAAGWKFNSSQASDAVMDAEGKIADVRGSRALGRDFDFRGLTWNPDRMRFREGTGLLNARAAFGVLGQMGIGTDNFQGGGMEALRMADRMRVSALDMGVDEGALASFVGTSMRSGETGRSGQAVTSLLARISGLIEEGNKAGVATSEKLGVLASLRQQEQAATGYVSAESSRITDLMSARLDATGVAALRGQAGLAPMQALAQNQNQEFRAMALQQMLDGRGGLSASGKALVDRFLDPETQKLMRAGGADSTAMAQAVLEKPGFRQQFAERFMKEHPELSGFQMQHFLGLTGLSEAQAYSFMGALRTGRDPRSSTAAGGEAPRRRTKTDDNLDMLKKEGLDALTIQGAAGLQVEMLKTTRESTELLKVIAANTAAKGAIQDVKAQVADTVSATAAAVVDPKQETIMQAAAMLGPQGVGMLIDRLRQGSRK